jgi:4-amino-4-deoxy-L-arabinose transferase-like glycosyltransferase
MAALVWWRRHNRGVWLARDLATDYRRLFAAQPVLSAFVLAAVCLSMLGAIVWSVAPEIRTDALIYQLAVPQAYVDHHGLVNLPGNFRSYWVGLANMPSTLGLLLTGQPLPQFFMLFQGVLLVWQGLVLFARLGGARAGLVATGLIATTPYLLRLESTAMTDVPAAVLAFGAVSAATRWWSDRRHGWLTLCGLLAGSALATQANTAFVMLPALGVVGWGCSGGSAIG